MEIYKIIVVVVGFLLSLCGPCFEEEICSETAAHYTYCPDRYKCCDEGCCLRPELSRGAITGYVFAGIIVLVLLIVGCIGLCHLCSLCKEKIQQKMKKSPTVQPSPTTNQGEEYPIGV